MLWAPEDDELFELLVQVKLIALAAYLALGAVFAVAFHIGGLHRVDAGTQGAGLFFRVLITPGVVALWPLMAARWRRSARGEGGPGPVHRPVSASGLRAFHRRLVFTLAVLVPIAAAVGIGFRPARPLAGLRAGPLLPVPAQLPQVLAAHDNPFAGLSVQIRFRGDEAGRTQLELDVAEDLEIPSLHLYWSATDDSAFPDEAALLGSVWGPGTQRFEFERESIGQGTLILHSAARDERVASFSLEDR